MQQPQSREQTFRLPPAMSIDYRPEDLYSIEEMGILRDWLKATLRCRGIDEFEKATKGWALDARAEVARILTDLRGKGFYPDSIDGHGRIVWGVRLKSEIEMEMTRNEARYIERGLEVKRNGLAFLHDINGKIETW